MKIIAIEGLDRAGKATIAKFLYNLLVENGYKVIRTGFPQYNTPTGELIRQWLTKEWDVDQATFDLITAADRQAQQAEFQRLENEGIDYLIIDRYLKSQIVYGTSSGLDENWVKGLHAHMRKPDLEIYLDIPAEVSMARVGKHNSGVNDRYEEDLEFLKRVRKQYFSIFGSVAIDANRNIELVKKDVLSHVVKLVKNGG